MYGLAYAGVARKAAAAVFWLGCDVVSPAGLALPAVRLTALVASSERSITELLAEQPRETALDELAWASVQ